MSFVDTETSSSPKAQRGVRRRAFVQGAIAGAVGATLSPVSRGQPAGYRETVDTPIVARHQVVVAGGGPSGVIAAVAAARTGADTLLIERFSFLGGNGTAGLMVHYNGWRNEGRPQELQTVKGIPAEYIAELVRLDGVADLNNREQIPHEVSTGDLPYMIPFDPEAAKIASFNMIKKEGVKLRLHSWIVAPMVDGSQVTGVIVESKSGREAIAADIVIDCTGDGDVAARAGVPFMSPARDGEGDRMTMSLMYQVAGIPPSLKASFGGIRDENWSVKWGPRFDADGTDVEELTRAEVETRLKLWSQIEELREKPEMKSVYLAQTATSIGVRETRRIAGEYVLTTEDALEGKRFPDVIAISSNPMPDYRGKRFLFEHEGFDIPYRSLVPKKVEGLVLSGRCISCEQGPFQSARSMAPAMAIGHASGCAAAMAATSNVPPRKLDIGKLQELLVKQNAELRI